jgi:hypothetical protein
MGLESVFFAKGLDLGDGERVETVRWRIPGYRIADFVGDV